MIKIKFALFWSSNLEGYGFNGNTAAILYLT